MDAVIVLSVALIFIFYKNKNDELETEATESVQLKTKLNEDFLHDEDAFMEIAHQLGFRNNDTI